MGKRVSYLPSTDADKVIWLNNFSTKIGMYATSLGITAAEVTSIAADKVYFQYVVNMVDTSKQSLNNLTAYKNMLKNAVDQQHIGGMPPMPVSGTAPTSVPEGIFDRVSKYVQRIKASTNYTENLGQDLGIIGSGTTINYDTLQPELKIKLDSGKPRIKCIKGAADAIDLYVDRKDGAGFIGLGRLLKPEYLDTASLPTDRALAEWEYKAQFVIGNDNVGIMSPTASIIVKRQ